MKRDMLAAVVENYCLAHLPCLLNFWSCASLMLLSVQATVTMLTWQLRNHSRGEEEEKCLGLVQSLACSMAREQTLSGPISRDIAVVSLHYPLLRDTFSAIPAIPQQGAIPHLVPSFKQTYQSDTPSFNISHDTRAMHKENKHETILRYDR